MLWTCLILITITHSKALLKLDLPSHTESHLFLLLSTDVKTLSRRIKFCVSKTILVVFYGSSTQQNQFLQTAMNIYLYIQFSVSRYINGLILNYHKPKSLTLNISNNLLRYFCKHKEKLNGFTLSHMLFSSPENHLNQ